ncbi:MAG: hypothetical protein ABI894_17270, partial [Ilumatobacteraceae bacterium]
GVDFSDEGIYLVSYRYYRHPEMVYNGAPAFFGPLFQLVGYSVVSLRRIKLILILISGVGLGWSTANFVHARPSETPWSDGLETRVAITLFVAAGGFTMYTWLPQSPGYNDLSVLCAMGLAAVVLPALTAQTANRRWWMAAAGAVSGVAVINKWPAGLCMILVVGAAVALAHGWREVGRDVAWSAGGLALGLVILAVVSGRFFDRISELRSASEQITDSMPVWENYLVPYWRNVADVSAMVGGRVWLFLAVGIALALFAAARRGMAVGVLLTVGVLLIVQASISAGTFRGATQNAGFSQAALPLLLVLAGAVWLIARVAGSGGRTGDDADDEVSTTRVRGGALVLMIGLAGAHAFGTLNPPLYVIISSGALCAAAIVMLAFWSVHVWRPAMVPMAALLIVLPLATERMMVSGLWQHPYLVPTNLYGQSEKLADVIGYDGLRTDAGTATLLHNLSTIARENDLVGRPGLSVSTDPGYTLALGLTQPPADLFVGSPEQYPFNGIVYEARLRTACSRRLIDPGNPPVILTAGPSAPAGLTEILADCGIAYPADFDLVMAESPTDSIGVWVPHEVPSG